ncbi:MAG TPA: ribosome maturation factor RimM [Acidimicrobiales bacterium]|nr:ribosome maturation factor RimM [Acidimicrobiales bacterium]
MTDRLEVGRISKPHGIRGEVVVALTTNRHERVAVGAHLWAGGRELVVVTSRPHQGHHLVLFDGVSGRDAAEALRGAVLTAEALDDPDELWVHELVGSQVVETDGTSRGRVEAVQANPAADLLVLDTGALVPLTFVVDRAPGRVVIDPPAGLFDL